jgi:hypothetical protein
MKKLKKWWYSAICVLGFCSRKCERPIFTKKNHYLCIKTGNIFKRIWMRRKIDGIRRSKWYWDTDRNK